VKREIVLKQQVAFKDKFYLSFSIKSRLQVTN